jgi:hypothetical protein
LPLGKFDGAYSIVAHFKRVKGDANAVKLLSIGTALVGSPRVCGAEPRWGVRRGETATIDGRPNQTTLCKVRTSVPTNDAQGALDNDSSRDSVANGEARRKHGSWISQPGRGGGRLPGRQ